MADLAYSNPNALVSTKWVAEHLDDPGVRIVEVVWGSSGPSGMEVYEAGHIPGAVAWDYKDDYFNPETGDIADKRSYENLLSRSGIRPETTIILYGGVENMNATYEYWLLKVYGFRDVRLLDGGRRKWIDENRPLTRDVPIFQSTNYHAKDPCWSLRASHEDILQAIGKENVILVNARTKEIYRISPEPYRLSIC